MQRRSFILRGVIGLSSLLSTSACASLAEQGRLAKVRRIELGKTSREEIHQMFGEPDYVTQDQSEVWELGGLLTERQLLSVYYDESGIVRSHEYRKAAADPCFIATAVYGSSECAEVAILRHFRDNILLKTSGGSLLVQYYYRIGPSMATWLKRKPLARRFGKLFLDLVVEIVKVRWRV
jgi:hypothetical protein